MSRWISIPRPNSAAKVRLFCFHHAGGGYSAFRDWPRLFGEADSLGGGTVELAIVQLPGRESRFSEPCLHHMDEIIRALTPELIGYLKLPFATFGHSMGSLVSFEVVRALRRAAQIDPLYFFASGRRAPQRVDPRSQYHRLPEAEFIRTLLTRYGAIPEVIQREPDLLKIFVPILRADVEVIETYEYREEAPFLCPLSVFGGLADMEVSPAELDSWKLQTDGLYKRQVFPGGHFYLDQNPMPLIKSIIEDLVERI